MAVTTQEECGSPYKFRNLSRLFDDISDIDENEEIRYEALSLLHLGLRLLTHTGTRTFGLSDGEVAVHKQFRQESEIVDLAKLSLRAVYLFREDGSSLDGFVETYNHDLAVRKLLNDGTLDPDLFAGVSLTYIVQSTFRGEFADRDGSSPIERLAFLPSAPTVREQEILNPAPVLDVTIGNVISAYGLALVDVAIDNLSIEDNVAVFRQFVDAAECLAVCAELDMQETMTYFQNKSKSVEAISLAKLRHAGNYKLQTRAIEIYESRKWPSTNKASELIHKLLKDEYESLDARLSDTGGQKTIYMWLLKHINKKKT